jgi:hypothetical protein
MSSRGKCFDPFQLSLKKILDVSFFVLYSQIIVTRISQHLTYSAGQLASGWVCAPNSITRLAMKSFASPTGTKREEDRRGG